MKHFQTPGPLFTIGITILFVLILSACKNEVTEEKHQSINESTKTEVVAIDSSEKEYVQSMEETIAYTTRAIMVERVPVQQSLTTTKREKILNKIINELYHARGGMQFKDLPVAKIFSCTTCQRFAYYSPKGNEISMDRKGFDFLYKEYGEKGLVMVIGHELGHHLQAHSVTDTVYFLEHFEGNATHYEKEKEADIIGNFLSYLSGYDAREEYPQILQELYTLYQLPEAGETYKYPPLKERQNAAREAEKNLRTLIQLYNLGITLSAAQEFNWANHCFEAIEKSFGGSEIYTNLAANQIRWALFGDEYTLDTLIWPVELEWETRLDRIYEERPTLGPSKEELERIRRNRLTYALQACNDALRQSPAYVPAAIHKLCAYLLLGKVDEAESFYHSFASEHQLLITQDQFDQIQTIRLLGRLMSPAEKEKILEELKEIMSSTSSPVLKTIIQKNLDIVSNQKKTTPSKVCQSLEVLDKAIESPTSTFSADTSLPFRDTDFTLAYQRLPDGLLWLRLMHQDQSINLLLQDHLPPNTQYLKPEDVFCAQELAISRGRMFYLNTVNKVLRFDDHKKLKEILQIN